MKVILIAGKAGSGKTYLGEQIVSYAITKNKRALQTEYSKYIKLYAKEIIGYDGSREKKPRKFLQDLGAFIRFGLKDEHFFTRRMLEDFRVYENYYDLVVVSDVRLEKEIEDIKNSKYDVITIQVKNKESQKNMTEEEKTHQTELELENYSAFDYKLENKENNDLTELAKQIVEGEK